MKFKFLKPSDEISVDKRKKCPLDRLPDGIKNVIYNSPFKYIISESTCHFHKSRGHMIHHSMFCRVLCDNYQTMISKYKTHTNSR